MAVEATYCKYKRQNFMIGIFIMSVLAVWFTYDGYFSEQFREKHTLPDGSPDSTLLFNQKSPGFFVAAAIAVAVWFVMVKDNKVVADDNCLVIKNKQRIPYDSMEKIDKTHFESKGFFVITYKDAAGGQAECKLSDRDYDNLNAVLDVIVVKMA